MQIHENVLEFIKEDAKSEPKGAKGSQKGAKRRQKWAKREPTGAKSEPLEAEGCQKWAKGRPKCINKSIFGKGREKGAQSVPPSYIFLGPFWEPFPWKIQSKKSFKNWSRKTLKIIAKDSQNGAEIDAKTHQKSMPKLVSKKIVKIM